MKNLKKTYKDEKSKIHKERCKELKLIRAKIAEELGIDLHQRKCTFEGYCSGTCPKCKSEELILNSALLKKQLEEAYHGENALFATSVFAEEIVAKFPYFRITSFEKAYPNRIVVEVTEDAEIFALPTGETDDSYYILNVLYFFAKKYNFFILFS